jgi:DNA modification methylase
VGQQQLYDRPKPPSNVIHHGDCVEVMRSMPSGCVDFILTDPPYITRYKGRDGRTVPNDDNAAWLAPSAAQMFRVLKNDAFAISFYGWTRTDLFFEAWRGAGFRIAAHLVFHKRYASKKAYFAYRHESAFLLIKGNPPCPADPLPDVMPWAYSGNELHPTQKSTAVLKPLIRTFSKPGDTVLDPFAGSGSTLVAARELGRDYIGIDLDPQHHATATARLSETLDQRSVA